ncbi:MAG: baseplate J/gp47 family protein [Alphaproteobacteria bacterium]|jgi:uncharacterized phage protein gp47/JayE|nr:baseplate J/gp47 family protein [Alphaproteobacteria bacterium]
MSYNIPSPSEIQKRAEAEAAVSMGTQRASLSGTPENMYTRVLTVMVYEIYSLIAFIALQILPTTAAKEWLEEHASFWLEQSRKAAAQASGSVVITGTAATVIPAATTMTRDDGRVFVLDEDATIAGGGTVTASVTAEDAGAAGNTVNGIELSLSSTIVGVDSIVVDTDGLSGGTDIETDPSLLDRVKDRVQTPPRGGALHDYEAWATEVPGVTRAWAKESDGGVVTVEITFVMDNKTDTPIPTAGEVTAVDDYIAGVRPVGARPDVAAPTETEVDFEIEISPNTVAVQNAIKAELEDFFLREGAAGGTTLYLSRLSEVISAGAGENYHNLVSPSANQSFDFGELPVLGTITWSNPS